MIHVIAFVLAAASATDARVASLEAAAQKEIAAFVVDQLWGHYEILSVTVLETGKSETGADDLRQDYAFRSVLARFDARRNEHWSDSLNPDIPSELCDSEAELFLACRPAGYRFSGTLRVDMVFTVEGWKIMGKHHNSLQAYPLADYLLCEPDHRRTDSGLEIIRACFGGE